MSDYLEQFFKEKIEPYREVVGVLPLELRIGVVKDIRYILSKNMDNGFYKIKKLILPDNLEEKLKSVYNLTAQLGQDFGNLLLEKSGPYIRIGEDYAIIYSEIMGLFGQDKEQIKAIIFELFKERIKEDRILRAIGVEPHHIKAIYN